MNEMRRDRKTRSLVAGLLGTTIDVIPSEPRNLLLLAVVIATACSGPRISKQKAAEILEASSAYKAPKLVYLPRVIAIPADGIVSSNATREGEALTITQIASVDPVVAVLRARDNVGIEDFVSAVPGSNMLAPPPASDDDLDEDEGERIDESESEAAPAAIE